MLFNSLEFILFFPLVVIILFIIPKRIQWLWLLLCSYYFYMSWNPKYALLILTSTIITFFSSLFVANSKTQVKKKYDLLYLKKPRSYETKYNIIDSISLNKVFELKKLAEENPDINFLFVNSIKLDASKENSSTIDLIENSTKLKNISILKLNTIEAKRKLSLRFDDFYDNGHLRLSGSLKTTSYFADYLKKQYDFENFKSLNNHSLQFNMKNNKNIISVKDLKALIGDAYKPDFRVLVDSTPRGYEEVSVIISLFPKKGFEDLLENKSKQNKWKSDMPFRKFKNFLKTSNGYVGKLNSWSKLKPEQIDRIEMKFSGPGVLTEVKVIDLEQINLLKRNHNH